MNSLSYDLDQLINTTLAESVGFNRIEITKDAMVHNVWDGPLGINYYKLFPPQFTAGWKHLRLLVKAMSLVGYAGFELRKLNKQHWSAGFNCCHGPCACHGTTTTNWHGARHVIGENPGQAAAFAALCTLATGKKVETRPDAPNRPIVIDLTTRFDFKPILAIVAAHIKQLENRFVPDFD